MKADVAIIGGGIVGLATAYHLQKKAPSLKILILEKEQKLAAHQTGNNSGVIHSGIYYKPNSLKALNCIRGRQDLLAFCVQHEILHRKLGKVIIATREEELPHLYELEKRGHANGVRGVKLIDKRELVQIEPHAAGLKALWVPECYSVHYPSVTQQLAQEIQQRGGEIVLSEKVLNISFQDDHLEIEGQQRNYQASFLINCAGLFSDRIAKAILGRGKVPFQILPFRGEYFELKEERRNLVKGMIYPVPNPKFPFLGVHLTRMIDGKVEAGPNAILATAREGYKKSDVDLRDCLQYLTYKGFWKMAIRYWPIGLYEIYRSLNKKVFLRDLQRLIPEIQEEDLTVGGAGVRAQVVKSDGTLLDDFALVREKNSLHVLNAPSPAATASFSIGSTISDEVLKYVQ